MHDLILSAIGGTLIGLALWGSTRLYTSVKNRYTTKEQP